MKHNWEYKRLGQVCNFIGGGTPSKSNKEFYTGNIPWATVRDMLTFKLHKTELCITEDAVKNSATNILPKGMIVISTHVGLGKICELMQDTAINQDLKGISFIDNSIDKYFFTYWYRSIANFIISKGRGATVKGVTLDFMRELNIPVPPMEVQQQIVAELDKINEIIEDCRELLRNLDALAQSLFYDYFGDPITNPKGWEMKKLSDECLDIVDGDHSAPPKSDNGIPFITISNIDKSRHKIDFTNSFFVPQDYYDGLKENRKARKGDVLYTVTGSYGVTVLITDEPKFCFQRHIGLIRPKTSLNSVYMAYWGRSSAIKSIADTAATGIAQKTISIKALRNFPLILPPLSLQEKFAKRIEQIEEQKKAVEETITNLQTLLNSRMDYWFNG